MDLSVIRATVEAVVKNNNDRNLEDIVLRAASALPAEATDFDRGMAAGFAAALVLNFTAKHEQGISQLNG